VDVTQDTNFPRAKQALEVGLRAAFAFPVWAGTEVVAVLEFFSGEAIQPDEALLELMAHVGTQIGRVIERQRAAQNLGQAYHELRQTQQAVMQQERLCALGQMASGVAHDINNALSPIVGYADLLLNNAVPEPKKYLAYIKTAGEDIARIVARLREF